MLLQQLARRFLSLACALKPRIESNLWPPTFWKRLGNTPDAARKSHHRCWLAAWPEISPSKPFLGAKNTPRHHFQTPRQPCVHFCLHFRTHRNLFIMFASYVVVCCCLPFTAKPHLQKTLKKLCFCRFFSFWGLLDGVVQASWELFRAMVVRSWVVLACFGAKLRYVGGKMATKSAEMHQHSRKGALRCTRLACSTCGEGEGGPQKQAGRASIYASRY